jgi:hypothetical protein
MITTLEWNGEVDAGDIASSLPLAHGEVMEGGRIIFVKILWENFLNL